LERCRASATTAHAEHCCGFVFEDFSAREQHTLLVSKEAT
jgi:hypothetical protein